MVLCGVHQTFFICVGPTVPLLGLLLVLYNCFAVGPSPTDASPPLWLVAVKQQRYTLLIYAQYAAARWWLTALGGVGIPQKMCTRSVGSVWMKTQNCNEPSQQPAASAQRSCPNMQRRGATGVLQMGIHTLMLKFLSMVEKRIDLWLQNLQLFCIVKIETKLF